MIKNIILDVGGIILDDSKKNIERLLNKNCDYIYKVSYGRGFRECLMGEKSVNDHICNLKNESEFTDMEFILKKDNLKFSCPLMKDNFDYIKQLRKRGYKLFLLTNITEDSYDYMNEVIDINGNFDGGIYSYQEHLTKPSHEIFTLILNRFNLKKEETIYFDDKEKNVIAAKAVGIKSFLFTSIKDIENNLE